jgi:hypothetical protein
MAQDTQAPPQADRQVRTGCMTWRFVLRHITGYTASIPDSELAVMTPDRVTQRSRGRSHADSGWRRNRCRKVRRGGRAVMWPSPTLPDTWIRRMTGTSGPGACLTVT